MTTVKQIKEDSDKYLLKLYLDTESKIKDKLRLAVIRGNDTYYLQTLQKRVRSEIARLDSSLKEYSVAYIHNIYGKGLEKTNSDLLIVTDKAFFVRDLITTNPATNTLKILSENTYRSLSELPKAIGRQSQDFFREVGLRSSTDIVSGVKTVKEVQRDLRKTIEDKGFFYIQYKNGTKVQAKTYARMVARTTSAEAYRSGTKERIEQYGYDLVDIIGHTKYPDSPCLPFEGKTLSMDGKTKGYTLLEAAKAQGLFHPNCVHDFGLSEANFNF